MRKDSSALKFSNPQLTNYLRLY